MEPAMFVRAPPPPALQLLSVLVLKASSEPTSNTVETRMHATALRSCLRAAGRWRDCRTQQTSCTHDIPSRTYSHDQKAATAASARRATTTVALPSAMSQSAALRNCTTRCRISSRKAPSAHRQGFPPPLSCSRSAGPVGLLKCLVSRSKCQSRRPSRSTTSPCLKVVPPDPGVRRRFRLEGRTRMFRRRNRRQETSVTSSRGASIGVESVSVSVSASAIRIAVRWAYEESGKGVERRRTNEPEDQMTSVQ
jgi:hypothetical protein